MPYCTKEDIATKIPLNFLEMISDLNDNGKMDPDVIVNAIAEADASIDARLEKLYSVPFAAGSVPQAIRWISCWCAIESLAISRGMQLEEGWQRKVDAKKEELERLATEEDVLPELDSRSQTGPTRVQGGDVIPKFTTTKYDINGNEVNTDEVGTNGDVGGSQDIW